MFDWTVKFGDVLAIFTFVGSGWGIIATVRSRVDGLHARMKSVEDQMRALVEIMVNQGRQDERMNSIDARMVIHAQRMTEIDRQVDRLFEPGVTVSSKGNRA